MSRDPYKNYLERQVAYGKDRLPDLTRDQLEGIQRGTGRTSAMLVHLRLRTLNGERFTVRCLTQGAADTLHALWSTLYQKSPDGTVRFTDAEGRTLPGSILVYEHALADKRMRNLYRERDLLDARIQQEEQQVYG